MKKTKLLLLTLPAVLLTASVGAQTFTGRDVGTPSLPGSVTGTPPGTQTIVGGGDDIWNASDNFYYYYTTVTGQVWDAKVRVRDLQGPDHWTKCELMIRIPDSSGIPKGPDPFIAMMTTRSAGQNQIAPQWRISRGGGADWNTFNQTVRPAYPDVWLRMTRQGSLFSLYYSDNGTTWTKYADIDTANRNTTPGGPTFGTPWPDPILVGVAVTAHNDGDPTGGVATISDLSVTVTPSVPNLVAVTQVQDATAYKGSDAFFSFLATNAAIAHGAVGGYQWYKNDVAQPNATGPEFALLASSTDNGAKVYCKASVGTASMYSATGTVTVLAPTEYPGYLKYQVMPGKYRLDVVGGNFGAASITRAMSITNFDAPYNWADNYASRISGYFIPPVTGDYVFFIAADDDADLFLSTDTEPANCRLIAQEVGWSPRNGWTGTGSTQKRSDYWTPDGVNVPWSAGIHLVQGQKYFIMAAHREGGGGDNLGVYYKTLYDPDPADGDPANLTNGTISMLTWAPTTLQITQQPQDVTVFEAQAAVFSVTATTDGEFTPTYQWQRNQVDMPGRTARTLTISPASLADDGAKYRCIVGLPAPFSLSVTSAEATLTVNAAIWVPGLVKQELWGPGAGDKSRAEIEAGTAGEPTTTKFIHMFDQPEFADNYGQRLSTWFSPAQSGNYTFFLSSDDDSDLFLSTDDNPANKRLIAQQANWNGTRQWNGGMNLDQRRSHTFSPDGGVTTPYASGIPLVAGQKYYIEAVHHEGGGGDSLAVYYGIFSGGNPPEPPADGTESNIRGDRAVLKLPAPKVLEISDEPDDATVPLWGTASFSIGVTTDALYPPSYQWRRGGVNIAGATTSAYSLATKPGDNGATFDCVVTLPPTTLAKTSRVATLTVPADTTPPVAVGAGAIAKSDGTTIELGVEFNEPMDHASVSAAANYTLSKGVVTGVRHYTWVAEPNFDAVALEVTGLVNGDTVDLTIQNVKDYSLNAITPTVKSVTVNTAIRYGVVGGRELYNNPPAGTTQASWPDEAVALGNGNYMLISACNGHWDTYDEQTFVYEVLTGNFQRVVRVQDQDDTSNWARAGLMAREELQEGVDRGTMAGIASRNLNIRANPVRQWNGSAANNQIENYRREIVAGGYVGSGGAGGTPAYPNQWFKITRTNNLLQCFHSSNGRTWIAGGTFEPPETEPLATSLYVGAFYAPELNNNNSAAGIGHSAKAIFRSLGQEVVLPPTPPTVTITKSGNNVVISWTPAGGHLESRTTLGAGTWSNEGTANPAILPISGEKYFRVVVP